MDPPNQLKITTGVQGVFQSPIVKASTDTTFKIPQVVPIEELQKRPPMMCTGEVPRAKTLQGYSSFPQLCLPKSMIKDHRNKSKRKDILSISPDIFRPILPFPILSHSNSAFAIPKTEVTTFSTKVEKTLSNELVQKNVYLEAPQPRKENKCEKCDKVCKTPAALKAHMITHSDIKPFQCLQCMKFFKSENGVIAHLKIGHKMGLETGIEQYYTKIPLEDLKNQDLTKPTKPKEAKKRLVEGGGAKEGGVKRSRTSASGTSGNETFTFSHGLPPSVKTALLADLSQEQSQEKKAVDKVIDPPSMDQNKQFGDLNWPCSVCDAILSFKHTFAIHMSHIHSMRVVCDTCKRVYSDENILNQHNEAMHVN